MVLAKPSRPGWCSASSGPSGSGGCLSYVNGDNNLENLRRPDQTWKVRLIEEEFQRLMFDVEDV